MEKLEVIARLTIWPGQLEGFNAQAAEMMRLTRELDTKTFRYDWLIDEATMQSEVHEVYANEEGLFEDSCTSWSHEADCREVRLRPSHELLRPVSQRLIDTAHKHADESHMYSFFQGLAQPATV